jgi:putative ABC transport system ATP-binding protein
MPLARCRFAGRRRSFPVRRFAGATGEVRALSGVSLAVQRGTFTAITGPSGGGKSTLLALLGALDRPTEGSVLFDGADLTGASAAALARVRRSIGFVFQHSPMLRRLPAWLNVAYPLLPTACAPPNASAGRSTCSRGSASRTARRACPST